MKRFSSFLSLAAVFAVALLVVSCKSTPADEQQVIDVTGTWSVDSVITQVYPSDSIVKNCFSDSVRQEVYFGADGLYRSTVWQNDSVYMELKLRYQLSGDTLSYVVDNDASDMLELVVSCSDSALVTKSVMLYTDRSADLNTVYYSRVKDKALEQIDRK